jgi:TPR repeat protein
MYEKGEGVRQDSFKAVELLTKACDGGAAAGCANLGVMYSKGEGVRQDNGKALAMYGKACDLKLEEGCKEYARLKNAGVR